VNYNMLKMYRRSVSKFTEFTVNNSRTCRYIFRFASLFCLFLLINPAQYFPQKHIVLVVAITKHKDYHSILSELQQVTDTIICTTVSHNALPAKTLAESIPFSVIIEEDNKKAVQTAIKMAKPDGVVAVTGSLYLVGDVRETFS